MNRPTAIFFATAHMLYEDQDAVSAAYDLARSEGFYGFGRDRKWAALERVAPDLAQALRQAGCDIKYVDAGPDPGQAYRAVRAVVRGARRRREEQRGGWRQAVCELVARLCLDTAPGDGG